MHGVVEEYLIKPRTRGSRDRVKGVQRIACITYRTESQDTGTDESDEQDFSSCESSDDSVPTPDRNNSCWKAITLHLT